MHEMALCESLVQIIERQAGIGGFAKVKAVWLEVGPFSGAEPEALRFCFDAVTRGTVAEGAHLEIQQPPGRAWCMDCAQSVAIANLYDDCPLCGGHMLQVTGGKELKISQLEVE